MAFNLDEEKVRRRQKKPRGLGVIPMFLILAGLVAGSWYIGFIVQKEFNVQAYDLLNPFPPKVEQAPDLAPQGPTNFNN